MTDRRRTPLDEDTIEPHLCTLDLRRAIVGGTPFFAGLDAKTIDTISLAFHEQAITPGETIYLAGLPATRLYIVADGTVKLVRPTGTGQNVLLDLLASGEFFGTLTTLGDATYPDTAEAQTAGCVLSITAEKFEAILERYPSVALATLRIVAERLREAHEVIEHLSAHPAETRIAATLLKLAAKLGEEQDGMLLIQMPLSRQDVAEMTGTTTETASRVMSQFRRDGLIASGRRWVGILNQERLAELAKG